MSKPFSTPSIIGSRSPSAEKSFSLQCNLSIPLEERFSKKHSPLQNIMDQATIGIHEPLDSIWRRLEPCLPKAMTSRMRREFTRERKEFPSPPFLWAI